MSSPDVIVPEQAAPLPGPFQVQVQVRSEQTNGVLAVIGETLAPRILIPNHVHRNDVWVRVESGQIGVLVGDEVRTARAGEWALKPRDIEHAMWNPTDQPARIIEVLTPAGASAGSRSSRRLPTETMQDSPTPAGGTASNSTWTARGYPV